MKGPLIASVLVFTALGLMAWVAQDESDNLLARYEAVVAENERLRLFNAREVRRFKRPGPKVNWKAAENAEHALGCPASLIGAVWTFEDGPPDIETGVLGKTDSISKCVPMKEWPAFETGRTLNIYVWKWLRTTEEGQKAYKKVLEYTAQPYTNMPNAGLWARKVQAYEQQFREPKANARKAVK